MNNTAARPLEGRDVACPTCKAAAGAGCFLTRGRSVGRRLHGTHPARLRVSRARRFDIFETVAAVRTLAGRPLEPALELLHNFGRRR